MPQGETTTVVGIRLTKDELETLESWAADECRKVSAIAKLCFLDGLELREKGLGRGRPGMEKIP